MKKPRVFVSTLCCGEGDLPHCVSAIAKQVGIVCEHQIIHNLKELEAHNVQIESFAKRKNDFELFVKVDADTVLNSERAIIDVYETMLNNGANAAEIQLHDYYTNSLIWGLNFYRSSCKFIETTDKLYPDRSIAYGKKIDSRSELKKFAPIAKHGYYSTPIQAFRFGAHRGLKKRSDEFNRIRKVFQKEQDEIRWFVIRGFEVSAALKIPENTNYDNDEFLKAFEKARKDFDADA